MIGQELNNKQELNRYAKVGGKISRCVYIYLYRLLRKTGRLRGWTSKGKAQLFVQDQMASPENVHISDII